MDRNAASPLRSTRRNEETRIAVISSPRSGNTWLRHMLASIHRLEHLPVYNPFELNWATLPSRCALMTHWLPSTGLVALLHEHRFHVLTLIRHPLDQLLSILHYAQHHPGTARWMGGENGTESTILGASPLSLAFLAYATSARARSLLSVSWEWSRRSDSTTIRYEDLVSDTFATVSRVEAAMAAEPRVPISDVIEAHSLQHMRAKEGVHHWQGCPGLWRELVPAREAHRIAAPYERVFRAFGYSCDPNPDLTAEQADARWNALVIRPAAVAQSA